MATELVMTTEGYEALKAELNELKSVTRSSEMLLRSEWDSTELAITYSISSSNSRSRIFTRQPIPTVSVESWSRLI